MRGDSEVSLVAAYRSKKARRKGKPRNGVERAQEQWRPPSKRGPREGVQRGLRQGRKSRRAKQA